MAYRQRRVTERRLPFEMISQRGFRNDQPAWLPADAAFLKDMPTQLKQWPSQPPNGCFSKRPASMANTMVSYTAARQSKNLKICDDETTTGFTWGRVLESGWRRLRLLPAGRRWLPLKKEQQSLSKWVSNPPYKYQYFTVTTQPVFLLESKQRTYTYILT